MKTNLNTVSPVSEPAAFEEDVTAGNCLYLTRLCTPVREREEKTHRDANKELHYYKDTDRTTLVRTLSWAFVCHINPYQHTSTIFF